MKITVVTICLNPGAYLSEAVRSVLAQDYRDLEYLIIDGGSTDGSIDRIKAFAAQDDRVRWWSEPDGGISQAMNRGLERASGDVVAFLHADDFYPDSAVLARVAGRFSGAPGIGWLTGGLCEVDEAGAVIRTLPARRFSRRRLLRNNILFHPATFVRRELLKAVGGFDETLHYAMDYDLWLRLAGQTAPVTLPQAIACFRVHPASRSSARRLAALDEEYLVRKHYLHGPLQRCGHACWQKLRRSYEAWRGAGD